MIHVKHVTWDFITNLGNFSDPFVMSTTDCFVSCLEDFLNTFLISR